MMQTLWLLHFWLKGTFQDEATLRKLFLHAWHNGGEFTVRHHLIILGQNPLTFMTPIYSILLYDMILSWLWGDILKQEIPNLHDPCIQYHELISRQRQRSPYIQYRELISRQRQRRSMQWSVQIT